MADKKTLITTLISQHRILQKDAKLILEISSGDKTKTTVIRTNLDKFTKDLIEHLKLENDVFYVELLKEMKKKGQDTTKTEMFIAEMKGIEKAVLAFLDKYKDVKSIEAGMAEFHSEFEGIGETLNLRIETEEAGVYAYWGLF